jgi:hypothetical protein
VKLFTSKNDQDGLSGWFCVNKKLNKIPQSAFQLEFSGDSCCCVHGKPEPDAFARTLHAHADFPTSKNRETPGVSLPSLPCP